MSPFRLYIHVLYRIKGAAVDVAAFFLIEGVWTLFWKHGLWSGPRLRTFLQ